MQIFPSLNACTSLNAYTNRHEQTQQIYMHTHTHTQVATPTRLLFLCVLISAISGGYSYLRTRTHFPLCGSLFSLCGTPCSAGHIWQQIGHKKPNQTLHRTCSEIICRSTKALGTFHASHRGRCAFGPTVTHARTRTFKSISIK